MILLTAKWLRIPFFRVTRIVKTETIYSSGSLFNWCLGLNERNMYLVTTENSRPDRTTLCNEQQNECVVRSVRGTVHIFGHYVILPQIKFQFIISLRDFYNWSMACLIYTFSLSFSSSFAFQTGKFTSSYICNSNNKWNDISNDWMLSFQTSFRCT